MGSYLGAESYKSAFQRPRTVHLSGKQSHTGQGCSGKMSTVPGSIVSKTYILNLVFMDCVGKMVRVVGGEELLLIKH